MAKRLQWDDTDQFVFERWNNVRDLSRAFRRTLRKMRRQLRGVGEAMEPILRSKGLESYVENEWAEFKAYRKDWCVDVEEPLVVLIVGAVFPVGYFRVLQASPFICVYAQGLTKARDGERRQRLSELLFHEVGGVPAGWVDRTADPDWCSPLVRELPEMADGVRAKWSQQPGEMKAFALAQFEQFLPMLDGISAAVRKYAATAK